MGQHSKLFKWGGFAIYALFFIALTVTAIETAMAWDAWAETEPAPEWIVGVLGGLLAVLYAALVSGMIRATILHWIATREGPDNEQ